MATMSTYSGSWSCSRRSVPWKRKSNSINSSWNPTVGDTRLRSLQVTLPHPMPSAAPAYLTMDSVFLCVVKRPTVEVLCLDTESGIEQYLADFHSCPLEEGDLVLYGQGPVGGGKQRAP